MGGLFGVTSKENCILDLFFGVDYHSHLGTIKGGMATLGEQGFNRVIHSIQNSPFRTKFEDDLDKLDGNSGIGCISDTDSQPLTVKSHLGDYSICCVGRINNVDELIKTSFNHCGVHLLEGSRNQVNTAELVAMLIDQSESFVDGIHRVHELIDGSMTLLILTKDGTVIAARDKFGRTPLIIGKKDGSMCAASESFSYLTLGYHTYKELGPGEVVRLTPEGAEVLSKPGEEMHMCSFLWAYYGYPSSVYEGVNVENMRYRCGELLAMRDGDLHLDGVAGVPDSGTAHAIGYANASNVQFSRPLIKYTPTWPRSFTPKDQRQRSLIAKMKLIPVRELIQGRELLFIDDSIVRGTQLRETAEFLYDNGAKGVHIRIACPPVLYGCKYLNFTRSTSEMELFARRTVLELAGACTEEQMVAYKDEETAEHRAMVHRMGEIQNFSSLKFIKLNDFCKSISIPKCKLCTYCWNGEK